MKAVEDVDSMQAGRELDLVVALDVMGWEHRTESWYDGEAVEGSRFIGPNGEERTAFRHYNYDLEELDLPRYSTDIAAAWEVVEKINNGYGRDPSMRLRLSQSFAQQEIVWRAKWGGDMRGPIHESLGATAPLAICRAALKAVYQSSVRV